MTTFERNAAGNLPNTSDLTNTQLCEIAVASGTLTSTEVVNLRAEFHNTNLFGSVLRQRLARVLDAMAADGELSRRTHAVDFECRQCGTPRCVAPKSFQP